MNLLVVIPARGGSKGIPRKNLVKCAGKPLIDWTIDHALLNVGTLGQYEIDGAIVVSTDDPEIAEHARSWGVSVLDRPADLATDTALTAPVIAHAVKMADYFPAARPDLVAVLQPTVPARSVNLLTDCVTQLLESDADSLLTAYPLHFVWWQDSAAYMYDATTGAPVPPSWRNQCPRRPRRQDMQARELMYHEDGAVFVAKAELVRTTGAYVGGRVEIYPTARTVDVDTHVDLALAETLLTYRQLVSEVLF